MTKLRSGQGPTVNLATYADLHRILGDLDDDAVLAILDLCPTVADLEKAALWANGQADLLDDEHKVPNGTIARICDILTDDDDDIRPAPGPAL
jgi:hypothetical protein